jgi:hypothetical protein
MEDTKVIRFTRSKDGRLNGCFVAAKIDGQVRMAYSKCHRNDKFDKEKAKQIALGRLTNIKVDYSATIPTSLHGQLESFINQCNRCFKQ